MFCVIAHPSRVWSQVWGSIYTSYPLHFPRGDYLCTQSWTAHRLTGFRGVVRLHNTRCIFGWLKQSCPIVSLDVKVIFFRPSIAVGLRNRVSLAQWRSTVPRNLLTPYHPDNTTVPWPRPASFPDMLTIQGSRVPGINIQDNSIMVPSYENYPNEHGIGGRGGAKLFPIDFYNFSYVSVTRFHTRAEKKVIWAKNSQQHPLSTHATSRLM